MNCPACARTNDARRRYCGGCGENLRNVCAACEFENTCEDRFCGGCGIMVSNHVPMAVPPPKGGPVPSLPPPLPARAMMTATAILPTLSRAGSDEMAALFASPPVELETQLPEGGIVQSDVDRLFGAGS